MHCSVPVVMIYMGCEYNIYEIILYYQTLCRMDMDTILKCEQNKDKIMNL